MIGADGLWSGLRTPGSGSRAPEFPPALRLAGADPADAVEEEFRAADVQLWLGPNAHVVHYPVKGPASSTSSPSSTTLGRSPAGAPQAGARNARALLAVELGPGGARVLAVPDRWQKWALYDVPPFSKWARRPRDAHWRRRPPMLPSSPRARRWRFEDAAVLADNLARSRTIRPLPCGATSAPAQRTARVVGSARPAGNGRVYHLTAGEAWARNLFLRVAGGKMCCAATIGSMIGARRCRKSPTVRVRCRSHRAKAEQRERSTCFRPPSRVAAETVLVAEPINCGRSGGFQRRSRNRQARRHAAAVKLQEDAGIDIVTDGEQARQHFVHGFLEFVDGIDFANKVEMGIRNDRYKAMVPTSPARSSSGAGAWPRGASARAIPRRKLKITMPGR